MSAYHISLRKYTIKIVKSLLISSYGIYGSCKRKVYVSADERFALNSIHVLCSKKANVNYKEYQAVPIKNLRHKFLIPSQINISKFNKVAISPEILTGSFLLGRNSDVFPFHCAARRLLLPAVPILPASREYFHT